MAQASRFRKIVDTLMDNEKALAGVASWQKGPYEGAFRWLSPLAVNGVITGMNLCIDSYPRNTPLDFHIVLIYEVCISRLDFSDADRHHNHSVKHVQKPPNIEYGWVYGPHIHRWEDNRGLAMSGTKPRELEFAVKLPANIRAFDQAFWHFCAEAKILVAANQVPILPLRDTLI